MPFLRTVTGDALEVPGLGLTIGPDQSLEVDDAIAGDLDGHPLFSVTKTDRPPLDGAPGAPELDPAPPAPAPDSAPAPDAPTAS